MSSDLIDTARRILGAARRKPSQADLRRAVSTAYYAMFHTLARTCADEIAGRSKRSAPEWARVYRALEHGRSRLALNEIRAGKGFAGGVSARLADFCDTLEKFKQRRNEADYNPAPLKLNRIGVNLLIGEAETAIDAFQKQAPADQRRALAFACVVRLRA